MSQHNLFCFMWNRKLRAEYHFGLQPTANKGYWWNFRIFGAFGMPTSTIF